MTYPFNKITIIGAGLIGTSIAYAARDNDIVKYIDVFDIDKSHREQARQLKIFDNVLDNMSCVSDADIVFLCIPSARIIEVGKQVLPLLKKSAILTDVGSTKTGFNEALHPLLPEDVWYVPGHPIAGIEESGPKAGFAKLFYNKYVILTPDGQTSLKAVDKLSDFWKRCHAKIEIMSEEQHDFTLALTSHLPHLIAYNLTYTASHLEKLNEAELIKYSASGFRDFTRIAASDPIMWRDIFLLNKKNILEVLDFFEYGLSVFRQNIEDENADQLHHIFSETKNLRKKIIQAKQETDKPNFGRD